MRCEDEMWNTALFPCASAAGWAQQGFSNSC